MDQSSFQHSRGKWFMRNMQDAHLCPFLSFSHVSVQWIPPSKTWVVCPSNVEYDGTPFVINTINSFDTVLQNSPSWKIVGRQIKCYARLGSGFSGDLEKAPVALKFTWKFFKPTWEWRGPKSNWWWRNVPLISTISICQAVIGGRPSTPQGHWPWKWPFRFLDGGIGDGVYMYGCYMYIYIYLWHCFPNATFFCWPTWGTHKGKPTPVRQYIHQHSEHARMGWRLQVNSYINVGNAPKVFWLYICLKHSSL